MFSTSHTPLPFTHTLSFIFTHSCPDTLCQVPLRLKGHGQWRSFLHRTGGPSVRHHALVTVYRLTYSVCCLCCMWKRTTINMLSSAECSRVMMEWWTHLWHWQPTSAKNCLDSHRWHTAPKDQRLWPQQCYTHTHKVTIRKWRPDRASSGKKYSICCHRLKSIKTDNLIHGYIRLSDFSNSENWGSVNKNVFNSHTVHPIFSTKPLN